MKVKKELKDISHDFRLDSLIMTGILFILIFTYFLFPARHIILFQHEQFLFIFSGNYLKSFLAYPGGILEYAGKFLMQFYNYPVIGAGLLAIFIILPGIIVKMIVTKLNEVSAKWPLSIATMMLLFLMQNQYYHMMEYNLGYSAALAFFLFSIKCRVRWFPLIIAPAFYYIFGAYALVFFGVYLIYSLAYSDHFHKFLRPIGLLAVIAVSWFIFSRVVFLVPEGTLLSFPLPLVNDPSHKTLFIIITTYLIFLPVISRINITHGSGLLKRRFTGMLTGVLMICITALFAFRASNPMITRALKIQAASYENDWDKVIKLQETRPSGNLVGDYFYNVALSQKGLLCERMFSGFQVFGTSSLILPWGNEHLERGAYFFYTAGLVNEAHRWAYEEMVVNGLRPHNLKMLIRTSLLCGNHLIASKYINILKKTIYRDEAFGYEQLINDPEAMTKSPDMGPVARIMPLTNFFIYTESPEDNLPVMFESNRQNVRSFEYMMAWLLLEKDVETVLSNIHLMKELGYKKLPKHIEEAVLIYFNSQGKLPDLDGFVISNETTERFKKYFSVYLQARRKPSTMEQTMAAGFGDTFWYYFHFHK